jgi:2-polyprenyl-3-methyl-5-hydroxy-6-metoxy-1,4-benzoquinol methylase
MLIKIIKAAQWKIAQMIEIRWWQNYLDGKTKEEYLVWKRDYWTTFLEKTGVFIKENSKILDLGCGPAGIFIIFEKNKVIALDPLLEEYEKKLPHFKKSDYPNVEFLTQPLEDFSPEKQGTADVVFCINAINHVKDLSHSFDILVDSVSPNGDLVVSIDVHNYSFFKYLFRYFGFDALHPHQYDLGEYEQMLTSRNCKIINKICYKKEFFFDYYVLVLKK